jgi:uncharacterized protein
VLERKGSRFNIAVPVAGDGDVLLFNTATGGLVRVDEDTYAQVHMLFQDGTRGVPRDWAVAVPEELDPDVVSALESSGFVVAGDLDELATLRDAFERERNTRNLKFTVGLTMACNFACPYCFEEHRNEHMSMTAADATFDFIVKQMREASAESVFVNWFGGEPLLNVDVLCHLSRRLREVCAATGVHYGSLVITNGALLTREVAERLREAGVDSAQVTIDGPAEIHDQRRPFKGGQASFARILGNVRQTFDVLRTIIRVNVDEGNQAHQGALVRALAEAGVLDGPHAVKIYPGKVTAYTEQSEMLWAPLEQRAIRTLGDPISSELAALGLPVEAKASPFERVSDRGGCSAMRKHSFVIGPLGQIFKCELGIHDDREALGVVAQPAPVAAPAPMKKPRSLPVIGQAMGTRAHDWDAYNPFNNPKCSGCQFVPVCKGGCPKRVLESDAAFMQQTCDYWDHNYKRLIGDLAASQA